MATPTDLFEEHRRLLFSVAYRMLGSAADAEDVVQDSWLRWSKVDLKTVDSPKAYLVRVVTNTALNRLRTVKAQRESYVGPWLPEPILTSPDVAEEVEMAESVSVAMLVVLETLSPEERAVFVLREVFGFPHAQIATTLGRSEASVRQLAHRARSHVQARRPRFEADTDLQKQVTDRFMAATLTGDIAQFIEMLAPDVTLWTDGGGKVRSALKPIQGADKVSRWLAGVLGRPWEGIAHTDAEHRTVHLNGHYSLVSFHNGVPKSTTTATVVDGVITTIHIVTNPDKLRHLAADLERE